MRVKFIALATVFAVSVFMSEAPLKNVERRDSVQTSSEKYVPETGSSLIGAEAAKADAELTLEDMLTYAMQDEYLAKARYTLTIEKFGDQRPFSNILNAEVTHISHLKPLFSKYNVSIPPDNTKDYVKAPANIKESLEAGVKGEIENIAMYERFLQQNIPSDVKAVFTQLLNASQNHLKAFKRTLSTY